MRLAVLTAVYPGAEPFLAEWSESIACQDDRDFTVFACDDGLGGLADRLAPLAGRLRVVPASGTPGAVRKQGLCALAAAGIDGVVFADCDDRFSPNRVSVARRLLMDHPLVANQLIPFGVDAGAGQPLITIPPGDDLTWRDLLHGNLLGLSNTAAHVADLLPHLDRIDDRLLAFDWALFTRVLHPHRHCRFTDEATTHYRLHAANCAGIPGTAPDDLRRSIRVKAAHYADLAGLDPVFAHQASLFRRLQDGIASDQRYLATYAAQAAMAGPAPGPWWFNAPSPLDETPARERVQTP